MSFSELQKAILGEGKLRVDDLRKIYKKKLSDEEDRIKNIAQELEETVIARSQEDGRMSAQRIHQTAQLKAKAEVLQAKQEKMQETRQLTVEKILDWDDKKAKKLITALFDMIPEDHGSISAGEVHADIVKEIAERKGFKFEKETIAGEGGFIFKSKDAELNVLTSHLVGRVFDKKRAEIARGLFN